MASDLETLCLSCGMCCDGTLFRRALLRDGEAEGAKKHGLRVIDEGKAIEQPCPQLVNSACAVYEGRPHACRSFVCALWTRHRDEGGPLEPRLASVRRVRELLEILKGYGLARSEDGTEFKFTAEGGDMFEAMMTFQELMELMQSDFGPGDRAPKG